MGNLLKKSDYSQNHNNAYQYASNSNRLTQVTLKSGSTKTLQYDSRGNLTRRNGSLEAIYNSLDKPTRIIRNGAVIDLYYDASWMRYKQVRTYQGQTTTTYYLGKGFEVEKKGTQTTEHSYISDIAILTEVNNSPTIRFTHRDRLGSTTTFTDRYGNALGYRSYDPFGKPRMGNNSPMSRYAKDARLVNNINDTSNPIRRGFTDHEHLDEAELIHMNGRVYDYNLGRFMSVDPFVHGGSQGINPYSYIMNNPLAGTDPTGYEPELDKVEIKDVKTEKVRATGSRIMVERVTEVSGTLIMDNGATTDFTANYEDGNLSSYSITDIGANTQIEKSNSVSSGKTRNRQDSENSHDFASALVSTITANPFDRFVDAADARAEGNEDEAFLLELEGATDVLMFIWGGGVASKSGPKSGGTNKKMGASSIGGMRLPDAQSSSRKLKIEDFVITDPMSSSKFRDLVKSIAKNGLKNNKLEFVMLKGVPYVTFGSNRLAATRYLGITNQLKFFEKNIPTRGYLTTDDLKRAPSPKLRGPAIKRSSNQ